jgi:hypothetical protein
MPVHVLLNWTPLRLFRRFVGPQNTEGSEDLDSPGAKSAPHERSYGGTIRRHLRECPVNRAAGSSKRARASDSESIGGFYSLYVQVG